MDYCPDCKRTTGGDCGAHGTYDYVSYQSSPIACIACGLSSFGMTQMPYPSKHDSDYICNDCLARIVDAAVSETKSRAG